MTVLATGPAWATLKGYGDGQAVQFWTGAMTEAGTPELLPVAPSVGDPVNLRLGKLFTHDTQVFWALFDTPMMIYNGPAPGGDELAGMALVRCRLTQAPGPAHADGDRLAPAVVLEVVRLDDLAHGPWTGDGDPDLILQLETGYGAWAPIHQGRYRYLCRNFEGDVGDWAIIDIHNSATALLVYGEWGFGEDRLWAGRARL